MSTIHKRNQIRQGRKHLVKGNLVIDFIFYCVHLSYLINFVSVAMRVHFKAKKQNKALKDKNLDKELLNRQRISPSKLNMVSNILWWFVVNTSAITLYQYDSSPGTFCFLCVVSMLLSCHVENASWEHVILKSKITMHEKIRNEKRYVYLILFYKVTIFENVW